MSYQPLEAKIKDGGKLFIREYVLERTRLLIRLAGKGMEIENTLGICLPFLHHKHVPEITFLASARLLEYQ